MNSANFVLEAIVQLETISLPMVSRPAAINREFALSNTRTEYQRASSAKNAAESAAIRGFVLSVGAPNALPRWFFCARKKLLEINLLDV